MPTRGGCPPRRFVYCSPMCACNVWRHVRGVFTVLCWCVRVMCSLLLLVRRVEGVSWGPVSCQREIAAERVHSPLCPCIYININRKQFEFIVKTKQRQRAQARPRRARLRPEREACRVRVREYRVGAVAVTACAKDHKAFAHERVGRPAHPGFRAGTIPRTAVQVRGRSDNGLAQGELGCAPSGAFFVDTPTR